VSEIRIISLADASYFKYLRVLVNSARVNFPEAKFHAVLVNLDDHFGQELQRSHPRCEYTIERVKFVNDEQKRCYCTNRRGYLLYHIRKMTNDILMWLDADSIIRKPCTELMKICHSVDFAAKKKTKHDMNKAGSKPRGFMGGLLIFGNTPIAAEMTARYYETIVQRDQWQRLVNKKLKDKLFVSKVWMANQDLLTNLVENYEYKIRFSPLAQEFLDCKLFDSSVIWSLKRSTRKKPEYKNKFNACVKEYAI
jgi:hypothetical protein